MPVLPRCRANAAAHAEWIEFTQFSSSTWQGACKREMREFLGHFVTVDRTSSWWLTYNLGRPLIRDVLFCFLSEVLVTNWTA